MASYNLTLIILFLHILRVLYRLMCLCMSMIWSFLVMISPHWNFLRLSSVIVFIWMIAKYWSIFWVLRLLIVLKVFSCVNVSMDLIIFEVGLLGAKLVGFSIEQNHKLTHALGELIADPKSYLRLMGHLIYLVVMRPDLAYFVHVLSKFIQHPK